MRRGIDGFGWLLDREKVLYAPYVCVLDYSKSDTIKKWLRGREFTFYISRSGTAYNPHTFQRPLLARVLSIR